MRGDARVSTPAQDVRVPRAAVQQAGCREEHVWRAIASGARSARPGWAACRHAVAPGDPRGCRALRAPGAGHDASGPAACGAVAAPEPGALAVGWGAGDADRLRRTRLPSLLRPRAVRAPVPPRADAGGPPRCPCPGPPWGPPPEHRGGATRADGDGAVCGTPADVCGPLAHLGELTGHGLPLWAPGPPGGCGHRGPEPETASPACLRSRSSVQHALAYTIARLLSESLVDENPILQTHKRVNVQTRKRA